MTSSVSVRAPCRLHFGMFSFGQTDRPQYGGVGVMVEPPEVEVDITPANTFHVSGTLANRAAQFVEMATAAWQLPNLPPGRINVRAPSDHVGLGVGTQLGLAIAAGLRRFLKLPDISIEELAITVRRASRSAVGSYGFDRGGLIVDAGHQAGQNIGTLQDRLPLPDDWRFLLVRPIGRRGLAGPSEADAFARLPPVPHEVTNSLWRIANEEMLPALERHDCSSFGEAVYQFGRMAGQCFAAVQGGPFATRQIAQLVDSIRNRGIAGVGQSSWGPTVFAVCRSAAEANSLCDWLQHDLISSECEITIANPNNEGAVIR